jgi:hypothetical protein
MIPMIIQTILLDPPGAVWTDEASNVSRLDPCEAVWSDAEHPSRKRSRFESLRGLHNCAVQSDTEAAQQARYAVASAAHAGGTRGEEGVEMATFVIVHGAWSGGHAWRWVRPLLRSGGHEVFTPALTALGSARTWPAHMSTWRPTSAT